MHRYRDDLPQLTGDLFLTDGGIETTLIFHDELDLPEFAAFDLLRNPAGWNALTRYFLTYAKIASEMDTGFVLEAATWRASPDWGYKLGYSLGQLKHANQAAVGLLEQVRDQVPHSRPMVISGCVGPRGDGYNPASVMSSVEAERYHAFQIEGFVETAADMVTAITMTSSAEAIGVTRAATATGLPVVISFTTETDGTLPSGETLGEAVTRVDRATGEAPAYYMINCAHTTHFDDALTVGGDWRERIRGLRTNASRLSHEELDEAEELDDGDPRDFGSQHASLVEAFPHVNVIGGCCGTDHRHIEAAARAILGQTTEIGTA